MRLRTGLSLSDPVRNVLDIWRRSRKQNEANRCASSFHPGDADFEGAASSFIENMNLRYIKIVSRWILTPPPYHLPHQQETAASEKELLDVLANSE